ncbi:uncharacterized protein B0H64DRAFT_184045 [Chaetomium fimeti]|uniref:C2H2-type domain-containing protein n=1 Tax=Chaetomium fimeti TaxID=1854472 RepID=A0AAE0LR04_9PEZI|nr:hypothetical protein B0H64DRAFT_184045 [Chaetomium fimeti]
MADSAGQPPAVASRPSPSPLPLPVPLPATNNSTVAGPSGSSAKPLALGAISNNVGAAVGAATTQQNAGSKPVFKMKRTGFTTLPPHFPAASHGSRPDPEPAKIISDILPPQLPATPAQTFSNTLPMTQPTSDGPRKTKYANDEERRKATSLALKQRWASGSMDHVHKKRVETIRRKKEAEALLGTPGIAKPSASVDRKKSVVSEKLARLFDKPVSAELATLLTGPRSYRATSNDSTNWSGSSNADMLDDKAELGHDAMVDKARPSLDVTLNKGHDGDVDGEGDSEAWSSGSSISSDAQVAEQVSGKGDHELNQGSQGTSNPITMAAPDRPYTKWRDENGFLVLTHGALIPDGYQFSTSIPGHPWICPVRSCRKVFTKIIQLGSHFVRKHRGAHLHDNEDGTFSERRIGLLRRVSGRASAPQPAIVVSRGPADPSDPPPVDPSTAGNGNSAGYAHDVSMMDMETGLDANTPASLTADGQGLNREDAEPLWSYLQHHVVKHKGQDIPMQGWVPQLIILPKVRDLDWNTGWLSTHPFHDTNARDVSALIIQVTGEPAPKPCNRCKNGVGPFRSCIMISSKADDGPLSSVFACANCFYHYGQTRCSHKQWGEERALRIMDDQVESEPPDESLDEIEDDEEPGDDSNAENEGDTQALDDENLEYTMDASNAETVLTPGGAPTSIDEAEPGRLYTMWPGDDGELTPLYGSLLPAGYQFDTTLPGRPWACPVRTCRRAHCKRADLGFHFQRVHFAACLNDNCDGTFTIKSFYQDKMTGIGRGGRILSQAPPIVVSRDPPARASPVPKAELPSYLGTRTERGIRTRRNRIPRARRGETAELWTYIQQHLRTTTEMPPSKAVRNLLTLPKQRDVKFNTHRRAREFIEASSRDIAALIIQVTGDEVSDECRRCRQGKGPFEGCVVASQETHDDTKARYPCCGNCLYGGNKLLCTLLKRGQKRKSRSTRASARDLSPVVGGVPARRSPSEQTRIIDDGAPLTRGNAARKQEPIVQPPSRPHPPRPQRSTPAALISQGNLQNTNDLLEMEDWEVAPGRIRETAAAEPDTIAFSKPYLAATSQTGVPVCEDVAFRVDTVLAGHALPLEADAHKTRLCSVAAGKVRVSIGEETEFVVGPHGMFKVKPGVRCVVRNGLYLEAVVHTVMLGGGY